MNFRFLAGLAALAVFTGCHVPMHSFERTEKKSLETEPLTQLRIEGFNGAIRVKPHDGTDVQLDIAYSARGNTEAEAEEICMALGCDFEATDGVLTVRAQKPNNTWFSSIAFDVLVPRTCSVDLKTSNGAIAISGIDAAVVAKTSNGRIDANGINGSVELHTSNGRIEATQCIGSVDLSTSNGRIVYSGVLGSGENEFSTSNGSIEVSLPVHEVAELNCRTSNGSINCDLPTQRIMQESKKVFEAIVGDGSIESPKQLKLRTSNGSISIKVLKEEELPAEADEFEPEMTEAEVTELSA